MKGLAQIKSMKLLKKNYIEYKLLAKLNDNPKNCFLYIKKYEYETN